MQFAATVAVFFSVLVLAIQTRAVARQSRVANEVAGTEAYRTIVFHWKEIFDVFIQYPELHAYYFDQTTAAPSATDSVRLKIIAEQHGDFLEVALATNETLGSSLDAVVIGAWSDHVTSQIAASSALRAAIRANPGLWPPLHPFLARYEASRAAPVVLTGG